MTTNSPDDFDVIIVGSGPAGVSAAFPLMGAPLQVLMVDGGNSPSKVPEKGDYFTKRQNDPNQVDWLIGNDFYSIKNASKASPKLGVPSHKTVFHGFHERTKVYSDNVTTIGSLARGGLSNAWGCGVACLSQREMRDFPFDSQQFRSSYENVALRIGISGKAEDDLSDYFGVDDWAVQPIPSDNLQSNLLSKYKNNRDKLNNLGFKLGRSRLAVLSEDKADRQACNLSGMCLWGCANKAMYNASDELPILLKNSNFHYEAGFFVHEVDAGENHITVRGTTRGENKIYRCKRVLLAAGTVASSKIAMKSAGITKPQKMLSCPTAAFLLWMPFHNSYADEKVLALGQLSFTATTERDSHLTAFGSLFNTNSLPRYELSKHLPFGKKGSLKILEALLPSCVVGNLFLPGNLTDIELTLNQDDQLKVSGKIRPEAEIAFKETKQILSNSFLRLGAIVVPSSFKVAPVGSDIHYSGSFPMNKKPVRGQTTSDGEVFGAKGLHIIDAACLPRLYSKPHTLTMMANADRISRSLLKKLLNGC